MATFLPATGPDRAVAPANGHAFTVAELQFFVHGYFEVLALSDGRVMALNEDGKRLQLAANPRATALLRDRLDPDDAIVGDVVLCSFAEMTAKENGS